MTDAPVVTVLIPAKNEEVDIERCLAAVLAQDYPHDRMEIVVVDGGSTDATAAVVRSVLKQGDITWTIVDNPVGTTPSNLNAGLAIASGEFLCRVDARSLVPPEYVRLCAEVLSKSPGVSVVGGSQVARGDGSRRLEGIARSLNNRYTMGGSRYRAGAPSGPTDTVYLGAFRRRQLSDAGGWNEYFHTNQDFELNRRMARLGIILFENRLTVGYAPRQTLGQLGRQYWRFGRWKCRYWRRTRDRPQKRQLQALAVPPSVAAVWIAAVVRAERRPRTIVALGAVGAVAMIVVDHLGGDQGKAPLSVRATSCISSVIVGSAWCGGVVYESAAGIRTSGR